VSLSPTATSKRGRLACHAALARSDRHGSTGANRSDCQLGRLLSPGDQADDQPLGIRGIARQPVQPRGEQQIKTIRWQPRADITYSRVQQAPPNPQRQPISARSPSTQTSSSRAKDKRSSASPAETPAACVNKRPALASGKIGAGRPDTRSQGRSQESADQDAAAAVSFRMKLSDTDGRVTVSRGPI